MAVDPRQALQELWAQYHRQLPEKIKHIQAEWEKQRHLDLTTLSTFHRLIHNLCGSAGTYGYPELSHVARQIERQVTTLLQQGSMTPIEHQPITELVNSLTSLMPQTAPSNTMERLSVPPPDPNAPTPVVYLMEPDESIIEELDLNLKQLGFETNVIGDLKALHEAMQKCTPSAVILNTTNMSMDEISQFNALLQQTDPIPTAIGLIDRVDLMPRLNAVRAGCHAIYRSATELQNVVQFIHNKCSCVNTEPHRILILDDVASLADYYAALLNQAGMIAHAITNPMKLLNEIEVFQPNLLLLDMYMPECNGFEIAKALQHDSNYTKIPIIFLSTEDDTNTKLSALNQVGEDFLTKPIAPAHLISAVKSKVRRANELNYYMNTDGLTGLLTHSTILRQLELQLERAKQQQTPLSLVMVDIDLFKSINDSHGHPIGDIVIQTLSTLLLTQLRSTDITGRYGGEEFVLILPGVSLNDAIQRCDALRQQFSSIPFRAGHSHFFATFSAGISCYDGKSSGQDLIALADQSLYHAKKNGRNQVIGPVQITPLSVP